jgi:hypothetical protein
VAGHWPSVADELSHTPGDLGDFIDEADWPSDVKDIAKTELRLAKDRWRKTRPEI